MKKLYFLNEEEKERILKLHESATKKQYLSEDMDMAQCNECGKSDMYEYSDLDEADAGLVGTAIATGGLGIIYGLLNSGSAGDGVYKIFQQCSKGGVGKRTQSDSTLSQIADKINGAVVGLGTTLPDIKSAFSSVNTIADLCGLSTIYLTRHGESLYDALDGDIDRNDEWKNNVYLPLLDRAVVNSKKQQSSSGSTGGASTGIKDVVKTQMVSTLLKSQPSWANYMCIVNNKDAKIGKMSNGSYAITIGNSVYYDNGRYKAPDGTMKSYKCPGTTVTPTTSGGKTSTTSKTPAKGASALSQSNVKQVQKLVGVAETGVFDDVTAKAVRTKLGV